MVRPLIVEFALLGLLLALLLAVGQFAIFVRGDASSWLIAGFALAFIAVGFYLGLYRFRRPPVQPSDVLPREPEARAEARLHALGISRREYEVLTLIARGLSNQEIGIALHISETTVKSHVSSLLAKLEARRRTEAVRIARGRGLLQLEEDFPTKEG